MVVTVSHKRRAGRAVPSSSATGSIDLDLTRLLSEQVAEANRLAFAAKFVEAIVRAYWERRKPASRLMPVPSIAAATILSSEAEATASRFGDSISDLAPELVAHFIGVAYASSLPAAYRASYGIFYTPPALVGRLLGIAEDAGVTWRSARVLDPAAGAGAFLVPIAVRMISAMKGADPAFILQQLGVRLHGFELDPFGAWLGQAMVQLVMDDLVREARRAAPKIIETRDSLDPELKHDETYDLVIGNPPYGRTSLSADRRKAFARSVYGHANLYGLFTDAALRWAKLGGVVAYVTPTSMLSGLYFKSLRRLIASEAPPQSIYFVNQREGVFADVLQETMLATYKRGGLGKGGKAGVLEVDSAGNVSHQKTGLIAIPRRAEAPWLLPRSRTEALLTTRLHSMPHRLSDYGYGVSTGPLVWNRFKSQFSDEVADNCYPVIWAESVTSDGRFVWRSERREHAPWFVANQPKDDWLIVTKPCVLLQRTTAKEQARRLIAAELPKSFVARHGGVIVENHLNMVRAIVSKPFVSPSVIACLLNSAAVDAAFRCLNGSVAVSAFELEELPLPAPNVIAILAKLVSSGAPTKKIEAAIAAAYRVKNASSAN